MKIEYSKDADAIYVYFKEDMVASSKEIEDGVVVDFETRRVEELDLEYLARNVEPFLFWGSSTPKFTAFCGRSLNNRINGTTSP